METTPSERLRRRARLVVLCLTLAFPLLVARSQVLTGDPTYYVGLAQSLAAGRGYTFMGQPHTTYPPGLPLLLAPLAALAPTNLALMQVVVAVFAPVALMAVLAFLRAYDARVELIVGALVAVGFTFFSLATVEIRTELPYLAASACALRLVWSPPKGLRDPWASLGVVVLTAATVLLRTIGTALPAAFLVSWAQRRLRRRPHTWSDRAMLVGGGAGMLAAASWFAWTAAHGPGSYVDLLLLKDPHQPDLGTATVLSMLARVPGSLLTQVTHLAELATGIPWLLATWLSPVTLILVASLAVGSWRELRSPNPVLGWYVIGYGVILLVWPFDAGTRFVFPIFPFLLLVVWQAWAWGLGRFAERGRGVPPGGGGDAASIARWPWLAATAAGLGLAATTALGVGDFPRRSAQGLAIIGGWVAVSAVAFYFWRRGRAIHLGSWAGRAWPFPFAAYALLNLGRTIPDAGSQLLGRETGVVELKPAIEWLRRHAAPGSVVMAQPASTIYLYTGLGAVPLPITGDRRTLLAALRESKPTYLLISDTPELPYYRPTEVERFELLETEAGDAFRVAYRFPAGVIYGVR